VLCSSGGTTTLPPSSAGERNRRTSLDALVQRIEGYRHLERDCRLLCTLLLAPPALHRRFVQFGCERAGCRLLFCVLIVIGFSTRVQRPRRHGVWPRGPLVCRGFHDSGDGILDAETREESRADAREERSEGGFLPR
jgi:hypothetical protein